MSGIRRVSQLGTTGESTYVDGSIQAADIAANVITQAKLSTDIPLSGFRNKIINGDMRINQRGASTGGFAYLVDRWVMYAGSNLTSLNTSTEAPAGFTNSIYAECTTASGPASYHGIVQLIEGNNIPDLGFGTAWAKPVVVSFWVKSTKTGVANFSFANNGNLRTYTTTYTIDVANTWEKKIIYINGDTSGTWLTTNGMGLRLWWDLGSTTSYNTTVNTWVGTDSIRTSSQTHNLTATLNARLYLTGVQLEAGLQATPFEQRPYGVELELCQRYCINRKTDLAFTNGWTTSSGTAQKWMTAFLPTIMRAAPNFTAYDSVGNAGRVSTLDPNGTATTNVNVGYQTSAPNLVTALASGAHSGMFFGYFVECEL